MNGNRKRNKQIKMELQMLKTRVDIHDSLIHAILIAEQEAEIAKRDKIISFEDNETKAIKKAKGKQSWHDFILDCVEMGNMSVGVIRRGEL